MHRLPALAAALLLSASAAPGLAATFATKNFAVTAPTDAMARQIAEAAEVYRRELALEWTGMVMPNWPKPCPVKVKVGQIGAGGQTTFTFDRGQVFGWRMEVQGTMERILDSILPHEVSHTVFACYFRRPLPRWADEGAATLVEHESERNRQTRLLNQVIRTSKRIPLKSLLSMTEYPTRMKDVLTLYAEGYALADLLVQKRGRATYLKVLETAHKRGWSHALRQHYGYESIEALETEWTGWVVAGSPKVETDTMVASAAAPAGARSQSPPPRRRDPFAEALKEATPMRVAEPRGGRLRLDRTRLRSAVKVRPIERTAAADGRLDAFRVPAAD